MIAADRPLQLPAQAKLLHMDASGQLLHVRRSELVNFLRPGDLLIANDAATLPASLHGVHDSSGAAIEVRLAARNSLAADDVREFCAIVFGAGDFRTRTEDRPLPPPLLPGDRLTLGPLTASVMRRIDHPRLLRIRFDGTPAAIWSGIAQHGRPIQYAHLAQPLALWDVWTPIAGPPVAFEPPSAGFVLDWKLLAALRARNVVFSTITHAAGISSTGDAALDAQLPFDEAYRIPAATAAAIQRAQANRGRIIAIGTSVVRALEHAALRDGSVHAGDAIATQRIGAGSRLRIVDAIVSGTHEADSSHYQLLRAFASDNDLRRANQQLELHEYRTHEFGDSVFVERASGAQRRQQPTHRRTQYHLQSNSRPMVDDAFSHRIGRYQWVQATTSIVCPSRSRTIAPK